MPYSVGKPPTRIKGLPKHAQEIWISAYNSAWETYDPKKARAEGREAYANSVAWGAVKEKYVKKGERWVAKEVREAAIPGRILMPPHGQLIQQHKKKAILSVTKDEEHIKVPIYIIQGDKAWAEVVLAPPVAITAADFRKSRAEHRVSDAEMGRWGWRGQQLYLYYFQSVKACDPPLEIKELEGAPRWVESVAFRDKTLGLVEEARHRRDHCMRCEAKPTKQVLWAEGKAIAWFCEKHLKQWHEEGEGWHAVDKLITVDGEALSSEEFKKVPCELKEDDPLMETIEEVIRKVGSKWVLFTRDGKKRLGEFDTKEDALKRERQIQFFKRLRESLMPEHEMAEHLESLTKEEIYQQGRFEGRIETLWALQDALPPESQITLASGFDTGLRILLDYIERLKAGAEEERKTS